MRQATIYSPGDISSSGNPRNLTTAPAALRMRVTQKKGEPNVKSTCLSPGGMIKATVLEIKHVDLLVPNRELGMVGHGNAKDHRTRNNHSRMVALSTAYDDRRSCEILCT